MPRVESVKHIGTQFYHSQFTNSHYLPDSSSSSASPPLSPISVSQASPRQSGNSSPASASDKPAVKKRHICGVCDRAFTTSGHLARHSRVHTGERNHKCPFPGCETRCSRQDNLQQHYRIHLSPGSRRSSTRSSSARAKKGSQPPPPLESMPVTPPLSPAPALEPARIYSHHSSPPDSPPPLAHATLPATATLPTSTTLLRMDGAGSDCSSSSAGSPQTSYSSPNHHIAPMSSQQQQQQSQSQSYSGSTHQNQSNNSSQGYSYRNGTTTYQEQSPSQGSGAYTYVHTTPISTSSGSSNGGSFSSYAASGHQQQDGYAAPTHGMQQQQTANGSVNGGHSQNRGHSPHSRHSISHISHPQSSYSQQPQQPQHQHQHQQTSSAGPASPASSHSVSSHTSGPPTPTYPAVFQPQHQHQHASHDDGSGAAHSFHHHQSNSLIAASSAEHVAAIHNSHIHSQAQSHIIQSTYSSSLQGANSAAVAGGGAGGGAQGGVGAGRFESPPPILAPIQDIRIIKRQHYPTHSHSHSQAQAHTHSASQYIHAPQPQTIQTEYGSYHHHSLALGHGAWKGESGMRKGVGTALV